MALRNGPADVVSQFTLSAGAGDRALYSLDEFHRWWEGRCQVEQFSVQRIPFAELDGWHFEPESGNLAHDSGRFFSVQGLRYRPDGSAELSQPIINQAETGILGILVKEFNGVLHCLMQAKMEPGNVNTLQLSPTVQATRSNYTRVHKGGRTRYLEYFHGPRRGRVLVDALQSEQGVWFWHKHNRNMVVQVFEDVPEHEDFHWLTLQQVHELLRTDNLVNMDARTVLGCMPLAPAGDTHVGPGDPFTSALRESYDPRASALHSTTELLSWFIDCRTLHDWTARLVPLNEAAGWTRTADEVVGDGDAHFRIIAVAVGAGNREVTRWSQPLLEPLQHGRSVFLAKRIGGVLHLLVQARPEPGLLDMVEMAPTVQLPAVQGAGSAARPVPFAAEAEAAGPDRIRFDALLSEEGGRFHHAQTRYQVIEVGDDFPLQVPEQFRWMTAHQLGSLLEHSHYLNIEARTLLACVHSLRCR